MIEWLFSGSGLFVKIVKFFILIMLIDISFFLTAFVIIILNDICVSLKLKRRRKHLKEMKE